MKKLLRLCVVALVLVASSVTVSAAAPNDSETITITIPIRVNASYTGSATAGDTQFSFTVTTVNGNSLSTVSGVTDYAMVTDYVTLANGHSTITGYITFTMASSEAAKELLSGNGIYLRQVVGNRSGWTYDTSTYKLIFTFYETGTDGVDADEYAVKSVSVNGGTSQDYSGTGWQLTFTNYYKSGSTTVVTPSTSKVNCAGKYDTNCDGVVTCAERYGEDYTWSETEGACVLLSVAETETEEEEEVVTNVVEVTTGDTTISIEQTGTGNNNAIVIIPDTSTQ